MERKSCYLSSQVATGYRWVAAEICASSYHDMARTRHGAAFRCLDCNDSRSSDYAWSDSAMLHRVHIVVAWVVVLQRVWCRLPSAHTCFNHLLLPEYESLEQLRERFNTAIAEGESHCCGSAQCCRYCACATRAFCYIAHLARQ